MDKDNDLSDIINNHLRLYNYTIKGGILICLLKYFNRWLFNNLSIRWF